MSVFDSRKRIFILISVARKIILLRPLPEIKCPALAVRLQANRLSVLGLGQYIFDRAGHFIFWNTLNEWLG